MKSIESRLEVLETTARRTKLAAIVLATLLAVSLGLGAKSRDEQNAIQDVLRCRKLVVVGDGDRSLVEASADSHGFGEVSVRSPDGSRIAKLGSASDGEGSGQLTLNSKSAEPRAIIVGKTAGAWLLLSNEEGNLIASIVPNKEGGGALSLFSKGGRERLVVTGDATNGGALLFKDADGAPTAMLAEAEARSVSHVQALGQTAPLASNSPNNPETLCSPRFQIVPARWEANLQGPGSMLDRNGVFLLDSITGRTWSYDEGMTEDKQIYRRWNALERRGG